MQRMGNPVFCNVFLFMDLSKTLELDKVARFNGEYNGEKFWFEAKQEMLTPRFLQQVKDWDTEPIKKAQAMSEVFTDWDIDMNGEPYPPTMENLSRVPDKFLEYCLNLVVESWQGNPPKPEESPST